MRDGSGDKSNEERNGLFSNPGQSSGTFVERSGCCLSSGQSTATIKLWEC